MGAPRILIVDDEDAIAAALRMTFEEYGWHVDAAGTAEDGLRCFRDHAHACVLVDKNLPDLDGVALIRRLRQQDARVRLVMITGYASIESVIATANLGIDAYLEKPFRDVFDVAARIERMLGAAPFEVAGQVARSNAELTGVDFRPVTAGSDPAPRLEFLVGSADPSQREALMAPLDAAHAHTVFASSSAELLDLLPRHHPDAVMVHGALDVADVVERVRAAAPDVVTVVVSDSLDIDTAKRLIDLRVNAIVDASPASEMFRGRMQKLVRGLRAGGDDDG